MEQSRQEAGQRAMDSLQGLATGAPSSERPPMANSSASNTMVNAMSSYPILVILALACCCACLEALLPMSSLTAFGTHMFMQGNVRDGLDGHLCLSST